MKSTTKSIVKLFLVISLFCSTALADDGHMGNGGKTCTGSCFTANETRTKTIINEPSEPVINSTENQSEPNDSFLIFIQEYLFSLFG